MKVNVPEYLSGIARERRRDLVKAAYATLCIGGFFGTMNEDNPFKTIAVLAFYLGTGGLVYVRRDRRTHDDGDPDR